MDEQLTAHDAWVIMYHARCRLLQDNKHGQHPIEAFRLLWAGQDCTVNPTLTIDLDKIFQEEQYVDDNNALNP